MRISIQEMDSGTAFGQMEVFMKASGKITSSMVQVKFHTKMVVNTLDSGKTDSKMVKPKSISVMAQSTLDNIPRVKRVVEVFSP